MKRKILIVVVLLSCLSAAAQNSSAAAQNFSAVLRAIEENNTKLAAVRQNNAANVCAMQAENTIGATSVEYSPFFTSGYRGIVGSELIVTQEFDYPTLYRERAKSADLRRDVLDLEYRTLRRDILLDATLNCYDLAAARENAALIRQRIAATDSLLSIYNRRLDHGHATIIDFNRIKMDRMVLLTEEAECQANALNIIDHLTTLNGGQPLPDLPKDSIEASSLFTTSALSTSSSFSTSSALTEDPLEVAAAEAELTAARHERNLSRKSWFPTFTAGFRVNTEMREANGGFVVGVAFPLFGNGKKQRAAQMRTSAAEMELADARAEAQSRMRALKTEADNLQRTLSTYDVPLMEETLSLLMRAVLAGEISIMDYYPEAERIYGMLQQRLATENSLNKVNAELHRDEL